MKSISNTVLQMVLSQGNREQNQHYPPRVYEAHYKIASEWLKNECVKAYPTAQIIIDTLGEYFKKELMPVSNGKITKPKLYRNLLGFGFFVNEPEEPQGKTDYTLYDFKKKKYFADPKSPTPDELAKFNAEVTAYSKSLDMVTIGEWNYFLTHPYKKPNMFKKAKGCIMERGFVEVRPMEIPYVEVRYVAIAPDFKYAVKGLPDDTYEFDPDSTVEELWNDNAIPYLFKGINILYANYVKDKDYIATAYDLRDNSIF